MDGGEAGVTRNRGVGMEGGGGGKRGGERKKLSGLEGKLGENIRTEGENLIEFSFS